MSVSISIADVLTQAAFRLRLPTFAAGEFISETDALALAKMSVSRLGAFLNRSFGDAYFARTATLSTQADVELVSLPTDFKDLLSLHWVNGNEATLLERAAITEYAVNPVSWSNGQNPRYRLEGSVLVFTPIPNAVYTLRCAYTTGLSITTTADTIQALPGCDEWLVLDMCELVRDREEKDASNFTARKMDIQADIKAQAAQRDRHGVTTVRDVRNEVDVDDNAFWRTRLGFGF